MSVDEWWDRSLDLDAQLEAMETNDDFRPGPERERIDRWSIDAHQRARANHGLV